MSLPWPDELLVGIGPARVAHRRRVLGWRGARLESGAVPVASAAGAPPWRAALDAFADLLPALARPRASARIVLSNHFVRYAVARWRDDLRSPAERAAFVRHCFREIYGDAAEGWVLRESAEPFGRASLACAVDAGLVEGLRGLMRGTRLRLAAVEPLLMSAFNPYRRLVGRSGCFLVHERGRLCGASFEGGEWRAAIAARVEGEGASAAAIAREALLHAVPQEAPIFLRIVDGSPAPAAGARPVKLLQPRGRGADPASGLFALAP